MVVGVSVRRHRDYINLCNLRLQLYAARAKERRTKKKTNNSLTDSQRKSVPFKKQIFSTWIITEEISSRRPQWFTALRAVAEEEKRQSQTKRKSSENLRLYNVWSIDAGHEIKPQTRNCISVLNLKGRKRGDESLSHFLSMLKINSTRASERAKTRESVSRLSRSAQREFIFQTMNFASDWSGRA